MLSHITARVEKELTEERSDMVSTTHCEPLFDLIHGIPGAGKSKVIAWICELFTDVLGWTSGNQFICLAVQNTMAANIGGSTIHHWGNIPFRDEKGNETGRGKGGKRNTSVLFNRCLNLRWILIDEISMVSAELLSELQFLVRQAVRKPGTYKVRPDKTIRPFGGNNTLLFGDWWQLRAVRATSLFDHPSKVSSDLAHEGLLLIWGQNRDSLQRVWELMQPMRCTDPWFTGFLMQCRSGGLSMEDYFFIHGSPTDSVGSMIPGADKPACGNALCAELQKYGWKEQFKNNKTITGADLMKQECASCRKERAARTAVAKKVGDSEDVRFGRQITADDAKKDRHLLLSFSVSLSPAHSANKTVSVAHVCCR